jgi:hypothetical protein
MQIGNWISLKCEMTSVAYPPLRIDNFSLRFSANHKYETMFLIVGVRQHPLHEIVIKQYPSITKISRSQIPILSYKEK